MDRKPIAKGTAREHILNVASTLFYEHGIRATSVDTIIAHAGITKKTFYYHFRTKDDLIVAYIERRDRAWRESLPAKVAAHTNDPVERVLTIFDILADRFDEADFRGCAFTNTIIETADRDHPAHHAAAAHKTFLREYIGRLLQEAGIADAQRLAVQVLLLIDGAFVTALREGTPQTALIAKQAAATLLHAAEQPSPSSLHTGAAGL